MAQIPGASAKHAIIDDTCRANRGDQGALDEAIERLRDEYANLMVGWVQGTGARFHLALTIERPSDEKRHAMRMSRAMTPDSTTQDR